MATDNKGANKGADGKDLPSTTAELVDAVVAKRRTVKVAGKDHGPGETVSLPADEVERLRERGFLDKPGVKAVAEGNGPRFVPQGGPTAQQE